MKKSGGARSLAFLALAALALFPLRPVAAAGSLTVIEPLDFGTFALKDNKGRYTIVLAPDDAYTHSDEIVIGNPEPQRGEYLLEGLPPDTLLDITITDAALRKPGNPDFTISDYTINDPLTTDASGNATLYIGATLTTSGTGAYNYTGRYTGTFNISVVF